MPVGMTSLVVRRLALMRNHRASLRPPLETIGEVPGRFGKPNKPKPNKPSSITLPVFQTDGMGSASGTAAASRHPLPERPAALVGGGAARDGVMESGIFLLALEVSAMAWLVGGWSSLVALRFRYYSEVGDQI